MLKAEVFISDLSTGYIYVYSMPFIRLSETAWDAPSCLGLLSFNKAPVFKPFPGFTSRLRSGVSECFLQHAI